MDWPTPPEEPRLSILKILLSVPGHDVEKIRKCRSYGADRILLDLEDSVPDEHKAAARRNVAAHCQTGDIIRVNSDANERALDIDVLISAGALHEDPSHPANKHAIWFPKVTLTERDRRMTGLVIARDWGILIENAQAAANLHTLAAYIGNPYAPDLTFGMHDFMAEMPSFNPNRVPDVADQIALMAQAIGSDAWFPPPPSLDETEIRAYAEHASHTGYTGIWTIHPKQVDLIKRDQEIRHVTQTWELRRRIEVYEKRVQENPDSTVIREGDKFYGPPWYRQAKNMLARIEALQALRKGRLN